MALICFVALVIFRVMAQLWRAKMEMESPKMTLRATQAPRPDGVVLVYIG